MGFAKILIAVLLLSLVGIASAQTIIAQNNSLWIEEMAGPGGTCWAFPETGVAEPDLFDVPSMEVDNGTWCFLSSKTTASMRPGNYLMLYEAPVTINGKVFKDVSWVNGSLVSPLYGKVTIGHLESSLIRENLTGIVEGNGLNTITVSPFVIETPTITINAIARTGYEKMSISGITNLANDTAIDIYIDEVSYYSQHNDTFTYHTRVYHPDNQTYGTWNKEMLMPLTEMPTGWHEAAVRAGPILATVQFRINMEDWSPNPVPTEHFRVIGGQVEPVIKYINTTTTILVPVPERTIIFTATPTPPITDALGDETAYPYERGDVIPWWVGIGGFCTIAGIVLVRGYTWKK